LLIESHMPIAELGAEARRENSTGQHPPPNRLHVWWARRPLVVSRAAVLGSLLPSWSEDWPEELRRLFPDEAAYREWFLRDLLGIRGDPVAARRAIEKAKETRERYLGVATATSARLRTPRPKNTFRLSDNFSPGSGAMAIRSSRTPWQGEAPSPSRRSVAGSLCWLANSTLWPTSFLRRRLTTRLRFGETSSAISSVSARIWAERVQQRLAPYFPVQPHERAFAYLWARTVACPYTGKPVPLSPNWWLRSKDEPVVAVRLIADEDADVCRFEIVRGRAARAARPERGTVAGGEGISPWTGDPIPEDYIKAEAQAGRMGAQLYAVAIQTAQGKKDFRLPTEEDLDAVRQAEKELARRLPGWEAKGLVPREEIPDGLKTSEPLRYGMRTWADLFSPRQLLALCTYLEAYHEVAAEVRAALPEDRARAVLTYLAFVLDKCADYNCSFGFWDTQRWGIRHALTGHDFSFKWSFGEFEPAGITSTGLSTRSSTPTGVLRVWLGHPPGACSLRPTRAHRRLSDWGMRRTCRKSQREACTPSWWTRPTTPTSCTGNSPTSSTSG
jgi:putative DNA methylase